MPIYGGNAEIDLLALVVGHFADPSVGEAEGHGSPANVPPIKSAADAVSAVSALVASVAVGEVTPSEAAELSKLIDGYVKSLEVSDLAERITELEMTIAHEPSPLK